MEKFQIVFSPTGDNDMAQTPNSEQPAVRRERLVAALHHREPDRVPILFGGPSCSIHQQAHQNLLNYLRYKPIGSPLIIDNILQIVEPDMRLHELFDVDALFLVPREAPVVWESGGEIYMDEFGRQFRLSGGFFNQTDHPLKEGSLAELARYKFPDLTLHNRVAGLAEGARRLLAQGFGLVGDGAWGIYEISSSLRGTAELFVDMAADLEYVDALAERVLEEYLKPFYTMLLKEVGAFLQLVIISDDYGSQEGLLFSPSVFRKVYKPRLRRLVEHIKKLVDTKVYIHSDGAISLIIPDFIEAGIDGLNPVQYTVKGMAADRLKREFGKDLGFFGGGIDNEILSFGSIEQVQREVRRQVLELAPGGGYLFATIHNIPPEAPPENVVACFRAAAEFGKYQFLGKP
jgi:uroporphyrinogen decarboxylase